MLHNWNGGLLSPFPLDMNFASNVQVNYFYDVKKEMNFRVLRDDYF